MLDSKGNKLSSYAQISQEAVKFFQNLIGSVDANVSGCSHSFLAELFPNSLSAKTSSEMVRLVTPGEVRDVMFSFDGGKL